VRTNTTFLARVLADPEFATGGIDTGFLGRFHG
jgi:biotin carboxylase